MNLVGLFIVSVYSLGSVRTYNFEDALYNQILLDGLEELQLNEWSYSENSENIENNDVQSRHIKTKFLTCCEASNFKSLFIYLKPYKKECYKLIKSNRTLSETHNPLDCGKVKKQKKDITCLAACLANKLGLISTDGYLSPRSVIELLSEVFSDSEWILINMGNITASCFPNRRGYLPQTTCDSQAMDAAYCIWREIQIRCPEERIKNKKICYKIRKEINDNNARVILSPVRIP